MKRLISIVAPLLLTACATYPNGPIVDGGPVRSDGMARLGQPTAVGALVATPQAVVEDSRCPMNVRCVWAGRAVVTTRIDGAGWRETVNLTLGQPHSTHGVSIALVSVQPEKMAGTTPSPGDYLFGFAGGR